MHGSVKNDLPPLTLTSWVKGTRPFKKYLIRAISYSLNSRTRRRCQSSRHFCTNMAPNRKWNSSKASPRTVGHIYASWSHDQKNWFGTATTYISLIIPPKTTLVNTHLADCPGTTGVSTLWGCGEGGTGRDISLTLVMQSYHYWQVEIVTSF